jgi:bifunctional DNA-binding transcriptional regulator/antitoxin component of YhaV-PrlF toxin-antitoxin module
MITVRVSDQSELHIPRHLSTALSLSDGDRVEIVRRGDLVVLQKVEPSSRPKPLRALAGLVKSSRPKGSVNVAEYMSRKGYEYLGDDQDSSLC